MPNRYICEVADELKESLKDHLKVAQPTAPVSCKALLYWVSLVSEMETLGRRMEASLYDKNDYDIIRDKLSETKKELKRLDNLKRELQKNLTPDTVDEPFNSCMI